MACGKNSPPAIVRSPDSTGLLQTPRTKVSLVCMYVCMYIYILCVCVISNYPHKVILVVVFSIGWSKPLGVFDSFLNFLKHHKFGQWTQQSVEVATKTNTINTSARSSVINSRGPNPCRAKLVYILVDVWVYGKCHYVKSMGLINQQR